MLHTRSLHFPQGMRPEVSTDESGSLRRDAALRALGPDRPEEKLAPLARVDGDAACRAVVDERVGLVLYALSYFRLQ